MSTDDNIEVHYFHPACWVHHTSPMVCILKDGFSVYLLPYNAWKLYWFNPFCVSIRATQFAEGDGFNLQTVVRV